MRLRRCTAKRENQMGKTVITEMMGELVRLNDVPDPPEVWGEFVLCFDVDFDVNIVTTRLGMSPYRAKRMSECRFNVLEQKQNPGYWEIRTEKIVAEEFDAEQSVHDLCALVKPIKSEIEAILNKYPGEAIFRLNVKIEEIGSIPAIVFLPEDLELISSMGAKLDIIVD